MLSSSSFQPAARKRQRDSLQPPDAKVEADKADQAKHSQKKKKKKDKKSHKKSKKKDKEKKKRTDKTKATGKSDAKCDKGDGNEKAVAAETRDDGMCMDDNDTADAVTAGATGDDRAAAKTGGSEDGELGSEGSEMEEGELSCSSISTDEEAGCSEESPQQGHTCIIFTSTPPAVCTQMLYWQLCLPLEALQSKLL